MISVTAIIISFHSNLFVTIIREKFKNLSNRNFVFNAIHDQRLNHENDIFFNIVNANFSYVQIRDTIDDSIFIFRCCRLELLQEYKNEECYLTFSNDAHLTAEQ